jgi:phosphoenolpyruvate-protein kinase (PTS system EI component)
MGAFDCESAGKRADLGCSTVIRGPSAPAFPKPEHVVKEVRFFSICTNDSIPYTLVVDRTYETVPGSNCTALPVVLR